MPNLKDMRAMGIELAAKKVFERDYEEAIIKCNLWLMELESLNIKITNEEFEKLKNKTINLIDDLGFTIRAEIRYILFPLPDIKKEAYEIGKKYMKNFLEWIKQEDNYTPERLMGILEDEIYRLEEARNNLIEIYY